MNDLRKIGLYFFVILLFAINIIVYFVDSSSIKTLEVKHSKEMYSSLQKSNLMSIISNRNNLQLFLNLIQKQSISLSSILYNASESLYFKEKFFSGYSYKLNIFKIFRNFENFDIVYPFHFFR